LILKLACEGGAPERKEFLVFGAPMIEEDEISEVVATLRSGWLGTGPKVSRFESMFCNYTDAPHALALHSCTAALHLSLLAAGIGSGDEVIVPSMTFCATANVVLHVGAEPVLVDVDRMTMNCTAAAIEAAITCKTKAIMPVHMAGRPCEMEQLMPLAQEQGLVVIEDAAHAIEAVCQGKKIGSIADATCFSFYVTKNLVTGEGGMVTTPHDEWAERIQVMALHGLSKGAWKRYSDEGFKHYQVIAPGYKYNMMDMQAALGIHQLPRLSRYLQRRERIWEQYDAAFDGLPVTRPAPVREGDVHARHLYTLLLDLEKLSVSRDHIMQALFEENIGTGIHFLGLHLHPFYQQKFAYKPSAFPNATWISERTVSLPLSARLTDRDVADVIAAVRKVLEFYQR
jgi:dTDP-4-amino-4,6-dideoxygalactose transaminase